MAKDREQSKTRLSDWLILAFVVVVMTLLVIEFGSSVRVVIQNS